MGSTGSKLAGADSTGSGLAGVDLTGSETDVVVWAPLFLLDLCYFGSEDDLGLDSTRVGGQVGHCKHTLDV